MMTNKANKATILVESSIRVTKVLASAVLSRAAAPGEEAVPATTLPEILLQAVITPGERTDQGTVVKAVALPWFEIIELLVKQPEAMYQLDWRKFEEIIAAAYKRQHFDVTLTPRSGDGG